MVLLLLCLPNAFLQLFTDVQVLVLLLAALVVLCDCETRQDLLVTVLSSGEVSKIPPPCISPPPICYKFFQTLIFCFSFLLSYAILLYHNHHIHHSYVTTCLGLEVLEV